VRRLPLLHRRLKYDLGLRLIKVSDETDNIPPQSGRSTAFPSKCWEQVMASFTANHCFFPYSDTHITTDAFRNEQPVPEEYLFALPLPHNGSTVLQEETAFSTPARSTGMRPGSSTGSVSGLIGHGGNINKSFDMLENSFSMWPSSNQSVLMGQIPCGLPAYNLTPFYFVPGSVLPTFDIDSYLVSTRNMWAETPSIFQNNSVGTLNIQVPSRELLPFGNPGWYPSDT
jgi:hypothetical protein